MSDETTKVFGNLPLLEARQADALCVEFEQAWRRAEKPRIEDFLSRIGHEGKGTLFRELLAHELDFRKVQGEDPDRAEYHARFPDLRHDVDTTFQSLVKDSAENTVSDLSEKINGRYQIERTLGAGAFGKVYLARDIELGRQVALKVPRVDRLLSERERQLFVEEARTAAGLDHPGIVAVYDVIPDKQGVIIVQQYVQGRDLQAFLKAEAVSPQRIAEIMSTVAEIVAFAHRQGYVHRDLKPSNILLDRQGQPHVADFGLAFRTSTQHRLQGDRSGTPSYMSPEQVRGEGHRMDRRSDIWSLGVITYEILCGRLPFEAATLSQLFDDIQNRDPTPPRELSPQVPAELERICLKCLSKRRADRYADADGLKDDLRYWLSESATHEPSNQPQETRIVPKGLRSFDEDDRDFFLRLLPGTRDRHGLPETLRFWKTRVESTDSEMSFPVGLIYGPSGCGKSSFVRAGLLPCLAAHVIPIYVESTKADTEDRILKRLKQHCPDIPEDVTLPEVFAGLREGMWTPPGKKILIILDQFEQWLQAQGSSMEEALLALALRQCDGRRVQSLLLVRDDFWAATSRFTQAIEINLIDGKNCQLVDLFEPLHARKVLAEFGRAYDRLPENLGEMTQEHGAFLDQSVRELEQDGRVICVRLALFADMMKGKAWNKYSLTAVGGTTGLGLTFLEETLSSPNAPAPHRAHQQAAKSVLAALLPEPGSQIKGHLRSYYELREASGYEARPNDFEALLQILDREMRLITPSDSGGDIHETEDEASRRYYQLTHDYLVPSIREWLARQQKETRRGRAELRLAERTSLWSLRRETRRLPTLWEFLSIICYTKPRDWKREERELMKRAGRYYTIGGTAFVILAGLISWFAVQYEADRIAMQTQREEVQERENELKKTQELATYFASMRDVEVWLTQPDPQKKADMLKKLATAASIDVVDRDVELRSLATRTLTTLGIGEPVPVPASIGFKGRSIALSPNGHYLAIGKYHGHKCSIKLIDLTTQESQMLSMPGSTLKVGSNGIPAVTFSGDGRWLAGGSEMGYVQVWEFGRMSDEFKASAGEPTIVVDDGSSWIAHEGETTSLEFNPDSSILASTSSDKTVTLWKSGSWEKIDSREFPAVVHDASFHPSKSLLICGTHQGLEILQIAGLEQLHSDPPGCDSVPFISSDGDLVALGQGDHIRLFDIDRLQGLSNFKLSDQPLQSAIRFLCVGLRGEILAGESYDGVVAIWSTMDGRLLGKVQSPECNGVAISNHQLFVVEDHQVQRYDLSAPRQAFVAYQSVPISNFDFSSDSNLLVTAGRVSLANLDVQVAVWTMSGQRLATTTLSFAFGVDTAEPSVAFRPDHNLLAIGFGGDVKFLNVGGRSLDVVHTNHTSVGVDDIAFSPADRGTLLVARGKSMFELGLTNSLSVENYWNVGMSGLVGLNKLSVGAQLLASCDREGAVTLWQFSENGLAPKERLYVQPGEAIPSRAVALRSDGEFLAMGNDAGDLRVVRVPGGEECLATKVSADRILTVAFGETVVGPLLAVGTRDGLLRLWLNDGESFRELFTWKSLGPITSARFSPDGKILAILTNGERAVRFWHLSEFYKGLEELGLGWNTPQPNTVVPEGGEVTLAPSHFGNRSAALSSAKNGGVDPREAIVAGTGVNPITANVKVNDGVLTDSDVGAAKFVVTVDFSEAMDTAVKPRLTFSRDVVSTLTLNESQSGWTDGGDSYIAMFDVVDVNVVVPGTAIHVTGARNLVGNDQQDYTSPEEFNIDTLFVLDRSAILFPRTQFAVGEDPSAVALGDVNGDGHQDIIAANAYETSQTISVLLGNGDGTFGIRKTYPVGTSPFSVALEDVDEDGELDIVTANRISNDVSVLLGNGDGTFGSGATYAVGAYPVSVVLADIDGDAHLDILTANAVSNNLSVLLGNGNGTFTPEATPLPAGQSPQSVAVSDIDGDGKVDIIVTANRDGDDVSVLLRNAVGTFDAHPRHMVGDGPVHVLLVDVTSDGQADIVTANASSSSVSVLAGNGDGTFNAQLTYPTGYLPLSVAVSKVNGDAHVDIVTANQSSDDVSVLFGNGDGTFQPQNTYAAGSGTSSVALSDVNEDGAVDIVTANTESDNVSVLLGKEDGTFPAQTAIAVGNAPQSVVVSDVNEDGLQDLIAASEVDDTVSVLLRNADGTFTTQAQFAVGDSPRSVAARDLNGDGHVDIVTANYQSDDVSLLLGNAYGTFNSQIRYAVGARPSSVALAYVNDDEHLDLVTANADSNNVSVLLNGGDGTFDSQFSYPVGEKPWSVAVRDVTGDGQADMLVAANGDTNDVSVLWRNVDGLFGTETRYAVGQYPQSVALDDVDRDGHLDIITANYYGNTISVLRGQPGGTFDPQASYPAGHGPWSVALSDINEDRHLDIVVTNAWSDNISVLQGNGDGTFALQTMYAAGDYPRSVALADINDDGHVDAVTANYGSNNVSVLLNMNSAAK